MQNAQKANVIASNTFQELERIILDTDIRIQLQPIVCLKSHEIVGYKALANGPEGSELERSEDLFSAATEHELNDELEYAALVTALDIQHTLPEGKFLSIQVGAGLFLSKLFREIANLCQHIADDIVFELNEQVPLIELAFLEKQIKTVQEMGYRVILDVTRHGASNMERAQKLKPSVIKLCLESATLISTDPNEREIFNNMIRELGGQTELQVDGIENSAQLLMLEGLSIHLGQGQLLSQTNTLGSVFSQ